MGEDSTAAGLDTLAELLESSGDNKLSRVGDAALNELLKRLEDPTEAGKLPGTGLLNIATSYVKIREKQLERDAGVASGPEEDEIQMILSQPLPVDRKIKLLEDTSVRLSMRLLRSEEAIEQLKGESHD